ncbi:MAG: hypothetical protein GPJ54_09815 [Candidatus Heimdallarchaeota archaeon]|nr:hypothetical protein [Candidatus Heimdallarchaeota archaeon]
MSSEKTTDPPKITEPMTMITDYLIALELIIFIFLLKPSISNLPRLYFVFLFLATAIGAISGGTSHGFTEYLGEDRHKLTWLLTVQSIAVGTTFFELAIISEYFSSITKIILIILILIQLVMYQIWIRGQDEVTFLSVIINYGGTMIISLLFLIFRYWQEDEQSVEYLIIGIVIAFFAAGIQQSGYKLHKHFNHNDLYHVMQMVALYFFYLAAKEFSG